MHARTNKKPDKADIDAALQVVTNKRIPVITKWEMISDDPPYWTVTLEGSSKVIKVEDIRDVLEFKRFVQQCSAQLRKYFMPMKASEWAEIMHEAVPKIIEIEPEPGSTRYDMFLEKLDNYINDRWRGVKEDDLLAGLPWHDEDNDMVYIVLTHLEDHLERIKFKTKSRKEITGWLRKLGAEKADTTIKNHPVRRWAIAFGLIGKAAPAPAPSPRPSEKKPI